MCFTKFNFHLSSFKSHIFITLLYPFSGWIIWTECLTENFAILINLNEHISINLFFFFESWPYLIPCFQINFNLTEEKILVSIGGFIVRVSMLQNQTMHYIWLPYWQAYIKGIHINDNGLFKHNRYKIKQTKKVYIYFLSSNFGPFNIEKIRNIW